MLLVLSCTGIRYQHKFAINMASVRQFSAIKSKNCLRALGHVENMTENVNVCSVWRMSFLQVRERSKIIRGEGRVANSKIL